MPLCPPVVGRPRPAARPPPAACSPSPGPQAALPQTTLGCVWGHFQLQLFWPVEYGWPGYHWCSSRACWGHPGAHCGAPQVAVPSGGTSTTGHLIVLWPCCSVIPIFPSPQNFLPSFECVFTEVPQAHPAVVCCRAGWNRDWHRSPQTTSHRGHPSRSPLPKPCHLYPICHIILPLSLHMQEKSIIIHRPKYFELYVEVYSPHVFNEFSCMTPYLQLPQD